MIGKKTIIVEDKLSEIFSTLRTIPNADGIDFQPVFKYGDQKALLQHFTNYDGKYNYPLIWLLHPYQEEHKNRRRVILRNLKFVLALNTNAALLNVERMEINFKPILYILLDNILDSFVLANTVTFDKSYRITKYSNYGNNQNEAEFPDLWDAISLEVDIEITDNCFKN